MELLDVRQRPLTVNEYHAMGEAGILQGDDRTELIDGRIITMPAIGWPHARCVTALTNLLAGRGPFDVSVQNPLQLTNHTEPLPDLVLLRPDRDELGPYLARDALLVIEVSDTSLDYDRNVKRPRYAQSGVPELWIVNIAARQIETFREPGDDTYKERVLFVEGDRIEIPGGGYILVDQVMPLK
jgi:Uma2 family endonuclease